MGDVWALWGFAGGEDADGGDRMQVRLYRVATAVARKRGVFLDELVGQMMYEAVNTLGITGFQVSAQLVKTYEKVVFAEIVMEGLVAFKGNEYFKV